MEKPISMKLQETKESIATIITESGLPMWLLEPAVKDIYNQINTVAAQEIYNDRKQYVEDLQKEKEISEENTTVCDENQTAE